MKNKIIQGDSLVELKKLPENSVDSIVTDPPYELGFMGKSWDSTGIANNVEMWKECLRVLKPGGHLLAFSGTRTYHRMASAIEDAGFEVRDMIEWVYGSGFPKSLNIGKAVDKLQGNDREVVGKTQSVQFQEKGYEYKGDKKGSGFNNEKYWGFGNDVTKGTSEWEGWGTALKPAHEPICMARKPLGEKTVAKNCLKWGTGGINIDESRVEYNDGTTAEDIKRKYTGNNENNGSVTNNFGVKEIKMTSESTLLGRFPANLILSADENGNVHEEVKECFPETKPSKQNRHSDNRKNVGNSMFIDGVHNSENSYTDSGSASRFFKSIIYQAKASKSDRAANGTITNNHPTVKPIALMEYLIKMVTPKGGIVLDPFAGSGSTLVAAKQNGYQYIGIELTEEYIPIIEARLTNLDK